MNVLITGGYGCIGSETRRVLSKDKNVAKIILLSRNERPSNEAKVIPVKAELYNEKLLLEILKAHQITHILHTAAIRTAEAQIQPLEAFNVNVNYTANLLEAARLYGKIQRFVFISTAAVYGKQPYLIDESCPTTAHLTYVASKLAAEQVSQGYSLSYGIPTIVVRPQIIFGPSRLSEGSTASVTQAMLSAATGKNFEIAFSGPHSFHFTEDVGALFALCLRHDNKKDFEVYNLPGQSYSCREIAACIERQAKTLGKENCRINVADNELPFPTALNHQKFFSDYPEFKLHDLDQAVMKTIQGLTPIL